jgi:hypothetical protein
MKATSQSGAIEITLNHNFLVTRIVTKGDAVTTVDQDKQTVNVACNGESVLVDYPSRTVTGGNDAPEVKQEAPQPVMPTKRAMEQFISDMQASHRLSTGELPIMGMGIATVDSNGVIKLIDGFTA